MTRASLQLIDAEPGNTTAHAQRFTPAIAHQLAVLRSALRACFAACNAAWLLLPCCVQVPAWQSWLLQAAVELRTTLLHQPYGDQALFVRRSTLQALNVSADRQCQDLLGCLECIAMCCAQCWYVYVDTCMSCLMVQLMGTWCCLPTCLLAGVQGVEAPGGL
jgi:hypothetical protein